MVLCTYTVQKYPIHRKTPLSHPVTTPDILEPAVSTTPRRSGMKRTDIRNDRPRARARDGWMVGRVARARDARRATERHAASIARLVYFLPPLPLVASSREGTDVVRHRRYRGSIPSIQYPEPGACFPRRLVEVTERARTRERGRRRR